MCQFYNECGYCVNEYRCQIKSDRDLVCEQFDCAIDDCTDPVCVDCGRED